MLKNVETRVKRQQDRRALDFSTNNLFKLAESSTITTYTLYLSIYNVMKTYSKNRLL